MKRGHHRKNIREREEGAEEGAGEGAFGISLRALRKSRSLPTHRKFPAVARWGQELIVNEFIFGAPGLN